uniref:Uncharacterized protein n=1 Tax=Ditylenchus dipsaci TaxID=166011 RepID=A0A915E0P7_9BILA
MESYGSLVHFTNIIQSGFGGEPLESVGKVDRHTGYCSSQLRRPPNAASSMKLCGHRSAMIITGFAISRVECAKSLSRLTKTPDHLHGAKSREQMATNKLVRFFSLFLLSAENVIWRVRVLLLLLSINEPFKLPLIMLLLFPVPGGILEEVFDLFLAS